MGLFQVIKQLWTAQTSLPLIADEIAERCIDEVWHRVRHQAGNLSPAEVRGYVRARGVAIVRSHLTPASARHAVLDHLRPQLHALTVEAVILRVQGRVRDDAGQRPLRRAA